MEIAEFSEQRTVRVTLSRRNLAVMLAKLEGAPRGSARTITKWFEKEGEWWTLELKVEEDQEHYGSRVPGAMHSETETLVGMLSPGWSRRARAYLALDWTAQDEPPNAGEQLAAALEGEGSER